MIILIIILVIALLFLVLKLIDSKKMVKVPVDSSTKDINSRQYQFVITRLQNKSDELKKKIDEYRNGENKSFGDNTSIINELEITYEIFVKNIESLKFLEKRARIETEMSFMQLIRESIPDGSSDEDVYQKTIKWTTALYSRGAEEVAKNIYGSRIGGVVVNVGKDIIETTGNSGAKKFSFARTVLQEKNTLRRIAQFGLGAERELALFKLPTIEAVELTITSNINMNAGELPLLSEMILKVYSFFIINNIQHRFNFKNSVLYPRDQKDSNLAKVLNKMLDKISNSSQSLEILSLSLAVNSVEDGSAFFTTGKIKPASLSSIIGYNKVKLLRVNAAHISNHLSQNLAEITLLAEDIAFYGNDGFNCSSYAALLHYAAIENYNNLVVQGKAVDKNELINKTFSMYKKGELFIDAEEGGWLTLFQKE